MKRAEGRKERGEKWKQTEGEAHYPVSLARRKMHLLTYAHIIQMKLYGPSVSALQNICQEGKPPGSGFAGRLDLIGCLSEALMYSRPGSNCMRTKTMSVGFKTKSPGGLVITYRLEDPTGELLFE